jgi:hypothetical protein
LKDDVMTTAAQILSQFQAKGVETCFHGRHISPQIYADLDGNNWRLKDYLARGGYQALRKILGVDAQGNKLPTTQAQNLCLAWPRRCRLSHRIEVELHASPIPRPEIHCL